MFDLSFGRERVEVRVGWLRLRVCGGDVVIGRGVCELGHRTDRLVIRE